MSEKQKYRQHMPDFMAQLCCACFVAVHDGHPIFEKLERAFEEENPEMMQKIAVRCPLHPTCRNSSTGHLIVAAIPIHDDGPFFSYDFPGE